uniref:Kazal-like domain-containing protein n=1 Tax=Arion vulgaris TaxID=1028688 RepID=A0A0B6ZUW5_9EUPU
MMKYLVCSLLLQAIIVAAESDCPFAVKCASYYDPVCGTDGETYHNSCYMMSQTCNRTQEAYTGPCQPTVNTAAPCDSDVVCTADYSPVCGTDGKTYSNPCSMKVQTCDSVQIAHTGPCDSSTLAPCAVHIMCTDDYNPVCGADGQTYPNACSLWATACGQIHVAHNGTC